MIGVKVAWSLPPFFFWIRGIWGSLLCDGQFLYHGSCSTEACMRMVIGHDRGLGLTCPLSDCIGLVCG
jgi:hypothetical protein